MVMLFSEFGHLMPKVSALSEILTVGLKMPTVWTRLIKKAFGKQLPGPMRKTVRKDAADKIIVNGKSNKRRVIVHPRLGNGANGYLESAIFKAVIATATGNRQLTPPIRQSIKICRNGGELKNNFTIWTLPSLMRPKAIAHSLMPPR